jgi:hypothetical protein
MATLGLLFPLKKSCVQQVTVPFFFWVAKWCHKKKTWMSGHIFLAKCAKFLNEFGGHLGTHKKLKGDFV